MTILLREISDDQPARVADLIRSGSRSKSVVYRQVSEMRRLGWIEPDRLALTAAGAAMASPHPAPGISTDDR